MPLLISFCNQLLTPSNSLLLVDESTRQAQWIDLPELGIENTGCTGIERIDEFTYVLTQSPKPHLLIYDKLFKILCVIPLHNVSDAHSLCYLNQFMYIISTGDNSIYRIAISKDGLPSGTEELYWRHPDVTEIAADLVHLNSITVSGNAMLVTCFGMKVEPSTWKSTTDGLCIDITNNNKVIAHNLFHPHTVKFADDALFICSSNARELLSYVLSNGTFELKSKKSFEGYTRGFAHHDTLYFLGQSESRKLSRSRGSENLPTGSICLCSKIYILAKDFSVVDEIDISPYGAEIYDICYIPSLPFLITDCAKEKRIESLERSFTQKHSELREINLLFSKMEHEFEDRTKWALDLEKESKQRGEHVITLQHELDSRTDWVLKLEQEVSRHHEQIISLQKELEERTTWALKLKEECDQRDEQIKSLHKEFEERTAWALRLDAEVRNRDQRITALQTRLEDLIAVAGKAIDEVRCKSEENADLRERLKGLTAELAAKENTILIKDNRIDELLNSMSWKVTAPFREIVSIIKKTK